MKDIQTLQKHHCFLSIRKALVKPISAGIFSFMLLTITSSTLADTLPTGGNVTAGSGTISQTNTDMTINQASQNMVIDWQGFSIGENNSVTFDQPSSSATALNRVIGSEISHIQGVLKANGRVFLINPSGVLFHNTASVNVGDLVVSTLNMSNEDFMSGNYDFNGNSPGQIINRGDISAADGGYVVFIAAKIENTGTVTANSGGVLFGAGSRVILDLGGPVKLQVEEAAIDALIEQGGAIRADGGLVYISAKAAGDLTFTVINHTGITEARTLSSGENGEIYLLGDMGNDRISVGGTLDASAPDGGDGGFIETSAAKVKIEEDVHVTTKSEDGETGTWLIDPNDFTIAASGGDMTGATATNALTENNMTIESSSGSQEGNGDIFVNDSITWLENTLFLKAWNNIEINRELFGSGTAKLALHYGQGTKTGGNTSSYSINAPVNLAEGYKFFTKCGFDGVEKVFLVITSLGVEGESTVTTLQGMKNKLNGYYVLGSDIDAFSTETWNGEEGFEPVGDNLKKFSGILDGLGHTITGLTINRPDSDYVGLFGYMENADIRNLGIEDASVSGRNRVGGLVGYSYDSTISNCYFTGSVKGVNYVGGLAGYSNVSSNISDSFSGGNVEGASYVGGLTGYNRNTSSIDSSFSACLVAGSGTGDYIGGLVGRNTSTVTASYWDTETSGMSDSAGGTGVTTEQMKTMTTFTGWDISEEQDAFSTWYIDPGNDYPRLRAFLSFPETPAGGDSGSNPLTLTPPPDPVLAAIGNSAFSQDPLPGPRFYPPQLNNWPLVGGQGINLPGDVMWYQNWIQEEGLDNRDFEGQDANEE